jgi:hypothetical protein
LDFEASIEEKLIRQEITQKRRVHASHPKWLDIQLINNVPTDGVCFDCLHWCKLYFIFTKRNTILGI